MEVLKKDTDRDVRDNLIGTSSDEDESTTATTSPATAVINETYNLSQSEIPNEIQATSTPTVESSPSIALEINFESPIMDAEPKQAERS